VSKVRCPYPFARQSVYAKCMSFTGSSSWPLHYKCGCHHFHHALRSSRLQQVFVLQLLQSIGLQCCSVVTLPLLPWHRIQTMQLHITFHFNSSQNLLTLSVTTRLLCKLAAVLIFCVCILCTGVQRDCANYAMPNILLADKHQDK